MVSIGHAIGNSPVDVYYGDVFRNEVLMPKFCDELFLKIGHNINFDLLFLNKSSLWTKGPYFCTQIYWHLIEPTKSSALKDLAERLLRVKVKRLEDIVSSKEFSGSIKIGCPNSKGFGWINLDNLKEYQAQDVELTKGLYKLALQNGISNYYKKIEQPLIEILLKMQLNGIKINVAQLSRLRHNYKVELGRYDNIFSSMGLNPRSPKQVGEAIFK